ncbi:copper resistance protein CopC [Herbiconiux sp. P18]|uniref:copper resistance CopC family protein n=1 Tax=Herbiconiux liangxiaofengii TaxID=3342795 RepID=UPI0035B7224B
MKGSRQNGTRQVGRVLAAVVLAAGLGLGGAVAGGSAASAHDFLVSTNPAADAVVSDSLSEVSLTFNEPPLTELGAGIAIEVHDASGANVASGDVSIVDSTLSIAVAPTAVGTHTVIWQTVSSDGHPVSGEYTFDYEGPVAAAAPTDVPAVTPTVTMTPSPTATTGSGGGPATESAASTPASPTPAAGSGSASAAPLVLVGLGSAVLVLIMVAVVVLLVLRRRGGAQGSDAS